MKDWILFICLLTFVVGGMYVLINSDYHNTNSFSEQCKSLNGTPIYMNPDWVCFSPNAVISIQK